PKPAGRKWPIYIGIPAAVAALAGLYFLLQPEEVRAGKIVVTPSPSVSAELFIDGKPSGPLPPFVHTVAAGSHRIEVRADGYKPFQIRVEVPSGGKPLAIEAPLVSEGPMQVEPVVMAQTKAEETQVAEKEKPEKKKHLGSKPPEKPVEKTEPVAQQQPTPTPTPTPRAPPPTVVVVDRSPRLRIVTDPPGAEVRVDGRV